MVNCSRKLGTLTEVSPAYRTPGFAHGTFFVRPFQVIWKLLLSELDWTGRHSLSTFVFPSVQRLLCNLRDMKNFKTRAGLIPFFTPTFAYGIMTYISFLLIYYLRGVCKLNRCCWPLHITCVFSISIQLLSWTFSVYYLTSLSWYKVVKTRVAIIFWYCRYLP